MAIDFPGSPALDQEFTSAGVTWKWDGQKWVSQSPGGGGGSGMPTGGGAPPEDAFYENTTTIDEDYQITEGRNAGTFGPVTVNADVTVPEGSVWTVVGGGEGGGGGGGGTPGARYQSGTWTPAFSDSQGDAGTSVTNVINSTPATWIRVGNQVTVSGWIGLTNVGNLTGNACLTGVPYPADNGYYSGPVQFWQIASPASDMGLTIAGNTTTDSSVMVFRAVAQAEATAQQPQFVSEMNNGSNVIFTLTYFTDDTSFNPATGSNVSEDTQGIGGGGATGVRYQEGDWTPTSTKGTLTLQPGRNTWSRIGNTVTLNGCIVGFSDNTSVDSIVVQSLPYICEGGTAGVCYAGRIATSAGQVNTCYVGDNSNSINFSSSSNVKGSDQKIAQYADINSTGSGPFLWFTIIYQTDDTTWIPNGTKTVDIQGGGGSGGGSGSGADAWASFDGTGSNGPCPLYGSQNIASIDKTTTGTYTVEFNTPMPSADGYSVVSNTFGYATLKTVNGFQLNTRVFTAAGSQNADVNPGDFAVFASSTITPTFTWTREGTVVEPVADVTEVRAPAGGSVVGYQQGIWTPVLNNNIVNTQTTYAARWTRIGQAVTLYGRIRWDGTPSAVSIVVSGLPYDPPPNADGGIYPGPCFCAGFVAGTSGSAVNNIAAYIASGSLSFYWQASSLDFIQVQYNAFSSTATGSTSPGIIFSVSYLTQDTTWQPINGATVD